MKKDAVQVTWLGHACFKLEKGDYSVVFDPYADGSVEGLDNIREKANEVFCSHEHHDHNARETVELIDAPVSANPFTVTRFSTYHDDVMGAKRGKNVISVYDDGDLRIAHFGDLGCKLAEEEKEQLMGLDIVMVPIGGFFTIDAQQAAAMIREISPKAVIPMHYRAEKFGFSVLGTVDDFAGQFENVICKDASCLQAEELKSMAEGTTIVILTPEMLK